jgi:hypothetical protein
MALQLGSDSGQQAWQEKSDLPCPVNDLHFVALCTHPPGGPAVSQHCAETVTPIENLLVPTPQEHTEYLCGWHSSHILQEQRQDQK